MPAKEQTSNCMVMNKYTKYHRSGNFYVKIICVKNFRVVKFSRFRLIRKIFLTVDDYNMALGELLAFSLLPGIRRLRDRSL